MKVGQAGSSVRLRAGGGAGTGPGLRNPKLISISIPISTGPLSRQCQCRARPEVSSDSVDATRKSFVLIRGAAHELTHLSGRLGRDRNGRQLSIVKAKLQTDKCTLVDNVT